MASNFQRGTVKLDASDWTRLKRLGGSRDFQANVVSGGNADVTNPTTEIFSTVVTDSKRVPEFGTSRTRRPASNYTDFVAAGNSDYATQSNLNNTVTVVIKSICNCRSPYFYTKVGLCPGCMSNRITVGVKG